LPQRLMSAAASPQRLLMSWWSTELTGHKRVEEGSQIYTRSETFFVQLVLALFANNLIRINGVLVSTATISQGQDQDCFQWSWKSTNVVPLNEDMPSYNETIIWPTPSLDWWGSMTINHQSASLSQ
jgi:hypothetical protein